MNELEFIQDYLKTIRLTADIGALEQNLEHVLGYAQRVGELLNEAEQTYTLARGQALKQFLDREDLTETIRKQLLESAVAEQRKNLADLKLLNHTLRGWQMAVLQAIKTRREEPR